MQANPKTYFALFCKAIQDLPGLTAAGFEVFGAPTDTGIDATFTIKGASGCVKMALVIVSSATPGRLRKLFESPRMPTAGFKNSRLLIGAPVLSEESLRLCQAAGAGAVDQEGNCWFDFNGMVLRRTIKETRKAAQPYEVRNLAYPKTKRVVMALLNAGNQTWKNQDLAKKAEVSVGQTYNICQWLVDQAWAEKPRRGAFRLIKPKIALDALVKAYEPMGAQIFRYFTRLPVGEIEAKIGAIDFVEKTIAVRSALAKTQYVLAGFSAARRWAPFVRHAQAQIYVQGTPDLLAHSNHLKLARSAIEEQLELEPSETGANVLLSIPADDSVFQDADGTKGLWVTSLIQTYLDLVKEPGRGEEAAEKVREYWWKEKWGMGNDLD
jgi:hypothetical protein